VLLKNDMNQ